MKTMFGAATLSVATLLGPTANAQSIAACEQTIQYNLIAPQADVPEALRAFSGVWTGVWNRQLCHVLIVEQVSKEGAVTAKYVYGSNPSSNIRPGFRQLSGKINGNTLMLRRDDVSMDYKLVDPATLAGTYSRAGNGQVTGTFKKQ
ncbi:MAG: hypothetical protein J0J01_17825 [Reyranella sp.]|nr:hypothetical protein [Reyranella sp.]